MHLSQARLQARFNVDSVSMTVLTVETEKVRWRVRGSMEGIVNGPGSPWPRTLFGLRLELHHRTPFTMDFSGFNAAEQAHMTKVIEKKQVCLPSVPSSLQRCSDRVE